MKVDENICGARCISDAVFFVFTAQFLLTPQKPTINDENCNNDNDDDCNEGAVTLWVSALCQAGSETVRNAMQGSLMCSIQSSVCSGHQSINHSSICNMQYVKTHHCAVQCSVAVDRVAEPQHLYLMNAFSYAFPPAPTSQTAQ